MPYTKKEAKALRKNEPYYAVEIRYSDEDEAYIATAPALPGCISDGKTRVQALKNLEWAIECWLETEEERATT
jgi:predicted RNase H-like HicB family nuclease